jgi:hypothetical protein
MIIHRHQLNALFHAKSNDFAVSESDLPLKNVEPFSTFPSTAHLGLLSL